MSNVKGGKSLPKSFGRTVPAGNINDDMKTTKQGQFEKLWNPFTKDGKTRKGDRTPTSSSLNTGP